MVILALNYNTYNASGGINLLYVTQLEITFLKVIFYFGTKFQFNVFLYGSNYR